MKLESYQEIIRIVEDGEKLTDASSLAIDRSMTDSEALGASASNNNSGPAKAVYRRGGLIGFVDGNQAPRSWVEVWVEVKA